MEKERNRHDPAEKFKQRELWLAAMGMIEAQTSLTRSSESHLLIVMPEAKHQSCGWHGI
jgi:hypothetical protein